MPQKIFGGKIAPARSPAIRSQRIKLLAAILLLELSIDQTATDFDFNELRRKLGLPASRADRSQTIVAGRAAAGAAGARRRQAAQRRAACRPLSPGRPLPPHCGPAQAGPRSSLRGRASTSARGGSDRQGRGVRHPGADRARHDARRSIIWTRPGRRPKRPKRRPHPGTWPSWACGSPAAKWPKPIGCLHAHSQRAHSRAGRGPGLVPNAGRRRHHRSRRQADGRAAHAKPPASSCPAPPPPSPARFGRPASDQPSGKKSALWTPGD